MTTNPPVFSGRLINRPPNNSQNLQPGSVYISTDVAPPTNIAFYIAGTWRDISDLGPVMSLLASVVQSGDQFTANIISVIDGGGSSIQANDLGAPIPIPFGATLIGWTILADLIGSAEVDILSGTNVASLASIAGVNYPALSSQQQATGNVSGWSTALAQNVIVQPKIISASTVQRLTIALTVSIP